MKKLKTAIFLLFLPMLCLAQEIRNEQLDGLWQYSPNKDELSNEFEAYNINKGSKRLFLTYWKAQKKLSSNIEYWCLTTSEEKKLSKLTDLSQAGNRYFSVPENCIEDSLINCVGRNCPIILVSATKYELYWHEKPDTYQKINALPAAVLDKIKASPLIFEQVKSFLPNANWDSPQQSSAAESVPKPEAKVVDKKETEYGIINKAKSLIYASPGVLTKMYFVKNDKIEVLETKSDWVKFKFFNKRTIIGWIKREDMN